MSSLPHQPDDPTPGELPHALARDLRHLYARDVRVPESVDAAILADARAGFARRRRFRLALRGGLVASGAAAAAAAVLLLVFRPGTTDPGTPQPSIAQHRQDGPPAAAVAARSAPEDVDRSGKVDILDAFVVARLVDLQGQLDNQPYDVNGDGKVDRADVDRIAMAAVDTAPRRPAADDGRVQ